MLSDRSLATGLAEAFTRGDWDEQSILTRVKSILVGSRRTVWIRHLVRHTLTHFSHSQRPRQHHLVRFFKSILCEYLERFDEEQFEALHLDLSRLPRPSMGPIGPAARLWPVPAIVTEGELAEWLKINLSELDWFTRRYSGVGPQPFDRRSNYRYRRIPKSGGGVRLLEIPKLRLLEIQRQILAGIVDHIPPHDAACAYRPGGSILNYVRPHANQEIVLHIDLREFFPSVTAARVNGIFRTAGYPERVARLLTTLCTNRTPRAVLATSAPQDALRGRYRDPHLPQGAPTSPALANLAAFWLDCRLSALADSVGGKYTRYADDLVISGGKQLAQQIARFRILACAIALHEDFEIRHRKTRVMRRGTRQIVAGIVVNQHPAMPRDEYDRLRALLYNCSRYDPVSQNREQRPHFREHLLGKISYWTTICPHRGVRLHKLFDQIVWEMPIDGSK